MTTKNKPPGYSTVSPYLIVKNAQGTIDFLTQAFDATPLRRYTRADGSIKHVEVKIDDTVIMMGEAAEDWPRQPVHLHVYVDDVDATYQRALAAGGSSAQEPQQQEDDPDRRGGVEDAEGNTWWISTPVG